MIQFELSTLINRPLETVSSFVSNPLNVPRWQPAMREIKPLSPGPVGPGSKFQVRSEMMGQKIEGVMEVVVLEPDKKFVIQMNNGPVKIEITFTFKTLANGTKLTLSAQGEPGGMFKLAEGMLVNQIKGQMEQNLARLKKELES
jgi:carbon monoxide dehydrogenase subunit G